MKSVIKNYPVFLLLLPIFFVLHGCLENYDFIPVKNALLLTTLYLIASLALGAIFWLFFKNFIKAGLFAFLIMSFQLFFGSIHDKVKAYFPGSFLTKYSFIIVFTLIALTIAFILLKRSKSNFTKINLYLNVLFLLLITMDAVQFFFKVAANTNKSIHLPESFTVCENCPKPDVYFIIADEYAGQTELRDLFQFDNSSFIKKLGERNFYTIPESVSNYNYTPFSIGSILDMGYLNLENRYRQKNDLAYSYEVIKESKLIRFFKSTGYEFYNYSIFDFKGQPTAMNLGLLPAKTKLITSQTFLSRINRDLRYHLVTFFNSQKEIKKRVYGIRVNNERSYNSTMEIAKKNSSKPKFVYTHLEMPHYPYYYDKNGKEQPYEKLEEDYQIHKPAYIEYLQYCNTKLLELIDHILKNSKQPPVIVLMGDHGFRHFTEKVEDKYHFLNLTSIHLPAKDYKNINDSLSGVNLFRVILNKQFRQTLPYLKDSTSYLND